MSARRVLAIRTKGVTMRRQHYIPTTKEKTEYLKDYLGAILIGLVLASPFIVYMANMQP